MRESTGTLERPAAWLPAFQTLQAWEAWQERGAWLAPRLDVLGADVRAGSRPPPLIDDDRAAGARELLATPRGRGSASWSATACWCCRPRRRSHPLIGDRLHAGVRDATMSLTCLAGLAGLPAVSLPVRTDAGLPAGVCLVAGTRPRPGPAGPGCVELRRTKRL